MLSGMGITENCGRPNTSYDQICLKAHGLTQEKSRLGAGPGGFPLFSMDFALVLLPFNQFPPPDTCQTDQTCPK